MVSEILPTFADFRRLILSLGELSRYVVDVTDYQMVGYVTNQVVRFGLVFVPTGQRPVQITTGLFVPFSVTCHSSVGQWPGRLL